MPTPNATRRRLMLASLALPVWPALEGCSAPLKPLSNPNSSAAAQALLMQSAAAHGLAALSGMTDLNVSYDGQWRAVVGKLQPALVDQGFRGASQERLLLRERVVGQSYIGPSGRKQVTRHCVPHARGEVRVWFNGEEAGDSERRAAAALVADGYSLFLLGPMLLAQGWAADRTLVMELAGVETVVLGHDPHVCDVLRIRLQPGLGFADTDELALFIDRGDHLMRRVRFTLNGLESTQGAVAEVDTSQHVVLHGVRWPTRFYEHLLRPVPLPVHDWHLSGLDVNRGLEAADVSGVVFGGKASAPAAALS